jgi:hypothetical protein
LSRRSECSTAFIIDLRPEPPPFGSPGHMFPPNFVAITTRSRLPRPAPVAK